MLPTVTRKPSIGFIDLNDVLAYIRSAKQKELRTIQIVMANRPRMTIELRPVKIEPGTGGSNRNYHIKENLKTFFIALFRWLFYVRSFRITSLSLRNRIKAVEICNKANYNVMDLQFKRDSINYFKMLNKGEETSYGYYIDTKEID
jgi:hypothetical protein